MNDCNLLNADFAPANLCGPGSCDWGNMKLDHVYFTCGTAQNVQEQCCADERNPDEVTTYRLLLSGFFTFDSHSRIFGGPKIPLTPRVARDQFLVVATLRAFQKWIRKNFLVSFNCNYANPNWWYRRNTSYAGDKTNWRNKSNSGN